MTGNVAVAVDDHADRDRALAVVRSVIVAVILNHYDIPEPQFL